MPTRIPVATRFVFIYLVVAALLSTVLIRHLVSEDETQLTHEVTKKGDAVLLLFARSLTNPLYQLDVDLMENAIGHVQALDDIREVIVFNERGQVVTDGTTANPQLGDALPGADEVLTSKDKRPRMTSEAGRLRFAMPVRLGDRTLGGVRLDLSLDNVHAKVSRLLRELVLLAAALILAGALPVWLVSHFLIKPLVFGGD